jgi:hypothetical protein
LAGGPNAAMQDKCKYEFTETETAYSDSDCSYASNEIAINNLLKQSIEGNNLIWLVFVLQFVIAFCLFLIVELL